MNKLFCLAVAAFLSTCVPCPAQFSTTLDGNTKVKAAFWTANPPPVGGPTTDVTFRTITLYTSIKNSSSATIFDYDPHYSYPRFNDLLIPHFLLLGGWGNSTAAAVLDGRDGSITQQGRALYTPGGRAALQWGDEHQGASYTPFYGTVKLDLFGTPAVFNVPVNITGNLVVSGTVTANNVSATAGVLPTSVGDAAGNSLEVIIPTTALTPPVVQRVYSAAADELQDWLLVSGTTANTTGQIQRPSDYNASTNAKIWVRKR